jgi:pyruvate/2-oxoglutarate dehydrogenase complex dihydrolipoamide acyltransferase (E2) component
MAAVIDIVIPDLGEFSDVDVIEVLVKPGDKVAREREDGLITLETDKATMDVPAPDFGVIEEMSVKVGDQVSTGDVIGRLAIEKGDTVLIQTIAEPTSSGGSQLKRAIRY